MTARSIFRFSLESEEAQSERRKNPFSFAYVLLRAFLELPRLSGHEELSFRISEVVDLQGCPGHHGEEAARSGDIGTR
jgi:hypothetical protein